MTKSKNPAIRFKGFTDDWEQRKLKDVADIVGGGTPSTSVSKYWDGDIDWYAPAEIGDTIFVNNSKRKITKLGLDKSSARILPIGTVLFTSRAGIGNTAILSKEGATNQGFQSIIPKVNQLESYFIYSKTSELKRYGEITGAGSTFVEVSGKQMAKMPVAIPKINEQTKIGNFFKQLDKTITLQERELELLKEQKKGFLQKMFPKQNEKVPELRFEGFTDDWEQRKLNGLAKFSKGKGYTKGDLLEEGDPIILYGRLYTNYQTRIIDIDTYVDSQENSILSEGGEVIVPSSGETSEDIARGSVVINNGIILGGDLNIIKPSEKIEPSFLALTISNGESQKELMKKAQGNSVVHLYNSDLKEVKIFYPNFEEQIRIGNLFNQLDETITLQEQQLEKMKEMKKGFLQKMFV